MKLPILATSLIHFSSKGRENVLFELGSEKVNRIGWVNKVPMAQIRSDYLNPHNSCTDQNVTGRVRSRKPASNMSWAFEKLIIHASVVLAFDPRPSSCSRIADNKTRCERSADRLESPSGRGVLWWRASLSHPVLGIWCEDGQFGRCTTC